ncbi:MAG: ATP-binding cassette domain-containing protein [Candidatus Saccharicenans sp.]|uniref:ATP-binding cassette domain-containing protein n=1 Tax=Candidatus Saccharicenans sp. TaxID=2819258 RepID=UPI004049F1D6
MRPAVEVDKLTKKFGAFTAVDGISFTIQPGTIFGFLGANGAGKSTTIRMLCGLLRPTSGRAMVAGLDVSREADRIKKVIGYMSQRFSLYLDLKVEENLEFFGRVYGLSGEKLSTSLDRLKKLSGLQGLENTLTGDLPTGWRQRLALSCALLHEPEIIFLDEPTGGVDPLARRQFWDLIYEQADRGRTVLVTTHYLDEAEYCHELRIIHAGRIIAAGSPQEIKKKYFPEKLLELSCDQPLLVYEWLKQQPEIKQVSLFGLNLHLLLEPDAVAGLKEKLVRSDIGQFELRPIVPSLEDVFIRRLEEQARESGK